MAVWELLERYIRDEAHLIIVNRRYERLYDFNRDGGDFPPDLLMCKVIHIGVREVDGCLTIMVA